MWNGRRSTSRWAVELSGTSLGKGDRKMVH